MMAVMTGTKEVFYYSIFTGTKGFSYHEIRERGIFDMRQKNIN